MRSPVSKIVYSVVVLVFVSLVVFFVIRHKANNELASEVLGEWFPKEDFSYGVNLYKVGHGVMYNRAYAFGKKGGQGSAAFKWKVVGNHMLFGQSDEEGHVIEWEKRDFYLSSDGKELRFDSPPMKLRDAVLFRSAQTPVGNRSEYSGQ